MSKNKIKIHPLVLCGAQCAWVQWCRRPAIGLPTNPHAVYTQTLANCHQILLNSTNRTGPPPPCLYVPFPWPRGALHAVSQIFLFCYLYLVYLNRIYWKKPPFVVSFVTLLTSLELLARGVISVAVVGSLCVRSIIKL